MTQATIEEATAEEAVQRFRRAVMDLIEAEIPRWDDTDPPRFALSVLWGRVRDLE